MRNFVDSCESAGLYVSRNAAFEPHQGERRQFNVISGTTGWKADIMWTIDRPFSHMEFSRRREVELLDQIVAIPSPEDIILAKLEWGGNTDSRQFGDAVSVLRIQSQALDHDYLARWAENLGIGTLLETARVTASW